VDVPAVSDDVVVATGAQQLGRVGSGHIRADEVDGWAAPPSVIASTAATMSSLVGSTVASAPVSGIESNPNCLDELATAAGSLTVKCQEKLALAWC